jgi:hypothetical protein
VLQKGFTGRGMRGIRRRPSEGASAGIPRIPRPNPILGFDFDFDFDFLVLTLRS